MQISLRQQNSRACAARPIALRYLFVFAVCLGTVSLAFGQSTPAGSEKSPLCTRDNALDMIKQQVDLTKTFNDTSRRITVLIRAAELLWPHQEDKARAVFTDAFDLAAQNQKENEQKSPRGLLLRMQVPDQRYVVIRAVARKDPAWAKELTGKILNPANDSKSSAARSSVESVVAASRLLESAQTLISTDFSAAIDLARLSFNYPASFLLTRFLYSVSEVNQQAADQLYALALTTYGDKPLREFLYLQAYPFAWHETLNTPVFTYHEVPTKFIVNQSLQRQFVQALLRRSQQALETPVDEGDTYRTSHGSPMPGTVHLLEGLTRLEPQVRVSQPDLWGPLTQAREKILVTLSADTQKLLLQPGREITTEADHTFAEQIEAAQKIADVNERDERIITAVFGSENESLTDVLAATDKVSDSNLRAHLLEWLYFHRATAAIKDKQFEEAERLAAKVDGVEQRAFLHVQLAKALLNKSDTQTHAREILDDAINEGKKAGATLFAARTLLSTSTLYAKIDLNQSISLLGDAVTVVNRLENPDFSADGQALRKTPERKGRGGQYMGEYVFHVYMPGLDPESAFREMAKVDFDTSLAQSTALTDKFQRALSQLALADVCLAQSAAAQPAKAKPKKNAKP